MRMVKRISCFVLVVLTIVTALVPAVSAATASYTYSTLPIIYVQGNKNAKIYNKAGEQIWPLKTSIGTAIKAKQSDVIRTGLIGISSGNWDPMAKVIEEAIDPLFKDLRLNTNGNIANGSSIKSNVNDVTPDKDGKYDLYQYMFHYDIRLDPLAVASSLRTYIQNVLKATGKSKVNLIGRCMGTTIVAAYLTKYKSDPLVNSVCFYSSAAQGVLIEEAPFSGELNFDAKALQDFTSTSGEEDMTAMLDGFINFFGSKTVSKQLNDVMSKAMPVIMPRILRATYGNFPSYWALLSDEYFNKCKDYIYGSKSLKDKYSGMLSKITSTHKNVEKKLGDTLTYLKENKGVKVNIITKYDKPFDSIYQRYETQGDGWIAAEKQSFGATFAEKGKKLSTSYVANLEKSGLGSYISGDRIIDATTALFPDSTWFIKGLAHSTWSKEVDPLIYAIFSKTSQVTIRTFSNYPQFLKYSGGQISIYGNYLQTKKPAVDTTSLKLSATEYVYDGNNKTPSVSVRSKSDVALKKGTDFTVTYEDSRASIGRHYVTVKFIGDYKGTASKKLGYSIKPGNVKDLVVEAKSSSSASVKWSAVNGAKYYKVYKYISSSKSWKVLGSTKSTSYTAKGLSDGKSETIAVRAFRDVGDVSYCSVSFTNQKVILPPAKVSGVTVTEGKGTVTFKWTKAGGAEMYQIYRSTAKSGVFSRVKTVSTNSVKLDNVQSGRNYYYKIRTVKVVDGKNMYGSYSEVFSAKAK